MRKEYDFSRGKRGAVNPSPGKTRITIMIDDEIIEAFRAKAEAAGRGNQTLMNEVLRAALSLRPSHVPRSSPFRSRSSTKNPQSLKINF